MTGTTDGFIIVAFDPAWAGDIGWCRLVHNGAGYVEYQTGTISPSKIDKWAKKRLANPKLENSRSVTGEGVQCFRALGIISEVSGVLLDAESSKPESMDRFIIAYETSLTWLLGASRRYRKKNPVTKKGIMTAAFAVGALWAGIADWMQAGFPWRIDISPMDTLDARKKFGVDKIGMAVGSDKIAQVARSEGYKRASDSRLKAMVGLAVESRLQSEPGLLHLAKIPETDHEADAAVFAFVRGDQVALDMRLARE